MDALRLLIVGEEREFLARASGRLRRRDVDVHVAATADKALHMLRDGRFDVALLDAAPTGMDALDLLRRMRELSPGTRVILLSDNASAEAAARGMSLGAFEYVLKPLPFEELYYKVLDAARSAGSGPAEDGA